MPRYKLTKDHYLQAKRAGTQHDSKDRWAKEPQLHEQGSEVDFDGKPSLHMQPLDKEAKERVQARHAEWEERKAKARAGRATVGWTPQFGANMERIIERTTQPNAEPMPGTRQRSKAA
jgi:hypothetical protein